MEIPSRDELLALPKETVVDLLLGIIHAQARQIKVLTARVASLEQQLRDKHGPGAPFSKGSRKPKPKPPGRRKGQGTFTRRLAPVVLSRDQVTEIDAGLSIDQRMCPECDKPLAISVEEVTVTDVPKTPVRAIKRIKVETGVCPICGFKVRGTHSDLAQGQCGATAHRLGPRVLATALSLHYHHGMPMRRVPAVLAQSTGIELTQSAINQLAISLTQPGAVLDVAYEGLREEVASSPVINTDDTGWRVDAEPAYLMGFFNHQIAFFQIRTRHRHQEVIEVIGEDFKGKLITDRGPSYEPLGGPQQKCISHVLRNLSASEKRPQRGSFPTELKTALKAANEHWHRYKGGGIGLVEYLEQGAVHERAISHCLRDRDRALRNPDHERLRKTLREQHEQGRLTEFLRDPEVEPTNNRAERGLRTAVIARKISQCSKNDKGSRAYATLRSIFGTLALRTNDVLASFVSLLQGEPMPAPV